MKRVGEYIVSYSEHAKRPILTATADSMMGEIRGLPQAICATGQQRSETILESIQSAKDTLCRYEYDVIDA